MSIFEIKKESIYSWFCIVLLAGYISISGLPYFLSVESKVITVPFRAFVLVFSIGIILYSYYNRINSKLNISGYFFIFFWVVYLINIYFSFKNYFFTEDIFNKQNEIYIRVIGVCFVPSLAIIISDSKFFKYEFILKIVYLTFFSVLLLNFFIGLEYDSNGRSSGILSTYSNGFGHYGATLSILSLYYLFFKKENLISENVFYSLGFSLGIYIIYGSGARSSLVSVLVVLGYILFLKKNIKYVLMFIATLVLFVLLIGFLNFEIKTENGSSFFSRLNSIVVSGNSSGRGEIYKKATFIFKDHPFFGGSFLFEDGTYAHNFILDILMSMGIFGLSIFMIFYKNSLCFLIKIKNFLNSNLKEVWVALLFLQFTIFSFFSNSLFDAPEFWYLTAITMVLFKNIEKRQYNV